MKKRAMKKWIPKGMYCHGNGTKKYPNCKWRKHIATIKKTSITVNMQLNVARNVGVSQVIRVIS